jgi:hypothetical protein
MYIYIIQREEDTKGDRAKEETIGEDDRRIKRGEGDNEKGVKGVEVSKSGRERVREESYREAFFSRDFTTLLMACTLIWQRPSHAFYDVSMHTCLVCLPSGKPETNKLRKRELIKKMSARRAGHAAGREPI